VTDENHVAIGSLTQQAGEWLTVDLGRNCEVRAVQVNFTDYKSGIYSNWANVYTQFKLHASTDGRTGGRSSTSRTKGATGPMLTWN